MKTKKINLIFIILGAILISQLFTSCGSLAAQTRGRISVNVSHGRVRGFNPYSRYTPRMWNDYCREYYHLTNDCTLQRVSANKWQVYTRGRQSLIKNYEISDFDLAKMLYSNGYDVYDELTLEYFHPVYAKGKLGYWVQLSSNGKIVYDFIIFSNGAEMHDATPDVEYRSKVRYLNSTNEWWDGY